jgi:hypothetical protein
MRPPTRPIAASTDGNDRIPRDIVSAIIVTAACYNSMDGSTNTAEGVLIAGKSIDITQRSYRFGNG